jgi:hypothetical protein
MKKFGKLAIGLIFSGICIYFAFRGINLHELSKSFQSAKYIYVMPVFIVVILGLYLRSYRWGIILESLVKYDQITLFNITSIGFMAVGLLPARLGEFARPYLVKQKSGVRMSSTIATIIVERVFDMLSLMIVLFVVLLKISLPPVIFQTGIITLTIALFVLLILIFLAVKKDFSLNKIDIILSKLPERLEKPFKNLANSFLEGLQILPDVKKTLYVSVLSIVIWSLICLSAYLLFFSFDINLPIINAFAITVIIALGVMVPAAPGFVGTYHFACVLGLTSFGISKTVALSYAILLHFLQMAPVIIIGLLLLPFQKISLPKFIQKEEEEMENEGLEK